MNQRDWLTQELELDTERLPTGEWCGDALMLAVDRAREYDETTWLTRDGKRVAAIVPVEQARAGS